MRVANAIALAAGMLLALLNAGCDHKTQPIVPATYRPLNTRYAPVFNLASTYAHGGVDAVDAYAAAFDSTTYEFVWDDPAEPGLTNTWDYKAEIRTAAMLTDPAVTSIGLTFLSTATDSVGTASTTPGDPPDTQRFLITGVALTVELAGTQYVTNGSAEFFVARTDTIAGLPQWRIIRWVDHTAPPSTAPTLSALHPVSPSTWGAIKGIYR